MRERELKFLIKLKFKITKKKKGDGRYGELLHNNKKWLYHYCKCIDACLHAFL